MKNSFPLTLIVAACWVLTGFAEQAAPSSNTQIQPSPPPTQAVTAQPSAMANRPTLEDGTPVKLRLTRDLSSADARVGDTVDFEVVEEVRVGDLAVIPKGGVAWGHISEAQAKRRLARGGKLQVGIDSVRLADGEKAALRAVKEEQGGGHTAAMTGAMVGSAIVFLPAAPVFLLMHGKDVTIPRGTEVTAYINGNVPFDVAKFPTPQTSQSSPAVATTATQATIEIASTPAGADIELDGAFTGNTPSSLGVTAGEHTVKITKNGYKGWERKIRTSTGTVKLEAELEREEAAQPSIPPK